MYWLNAICIRVWVCVRVRALHNDQCSLHRVFPIMIAQYKFIFWDSEILSFNSKPFTHIEDHISFSLLFTCPLFLKPFLFLCPCVLLISLINFACFIKSFSTFVIAQETNWGNSFELHFIVFYFREDFCCIQFYLLAFELPLWETRISYSI